MIRKFKCEVQRTDEYIIEIDDSAINEEWLKNFSSYMYDMEDLEALAEHIAQFRARFGERFIEGIGRPLENGEKPIWADDERELNKAININVVDEDNDCDVDVSEMEE